MQCPIGSYSLGGTRDECTRCDWGYTTAAEESKTAGACVLAKGFQYPTGGVVEQCPVGELIRYLQPGDGATCTGSLLVGRCCDSKSCNAMAMCYSYVAERIALVTCSRFIRKRSSGCCWLSMNDKSQASVHAIELITKPSLTYKIHNCTPAGDTVQHSASQGPRCADVSMSVNCRHICCYLGNPPQ